MASESWTELWIAAGALVLFAMAAALEAVVGLVGRERLRELADGPGGWRRTIEALLGPRRALTAALVTVEVVALAAVAAFLTSIFSREFGWGEHVLAVAAVIVAYVVFGMALPAALRRYRRDDTPAAVAWLAGALKTLVSPITFLGDYLAAALGRLLPMPEPGAPASVGFEEELAPFLHVEAHAGTIAPVEQAMIQGVLDLEDLTVREIMVPRVDMVAVELGAPAEEVVATIVRAGHSRIPVYRESIDQIVGVLYAKDLIPFVLEATTALPLEALVRPPYVVPDSKRVDVLLREMRRARIHLAIVADEYGGTAGLVTIEDVLEEIVGEIQDEYDVERPLFERTGDRTWVADARLPLGEVEEVVGVRFPEETDYDTLGGYVQTMLGRLPRDGDRFSDPTTGLDAEILAVEGRRVRRIRLTTLPDSAETGSRAGDDGTAGSPGWATDRGDLAEGESPGRRTGRDAGGAADE